MTSHPTPHRDPDPGTTPAAPTPPEGTPLPVRHYDTYQAARSHLWALAVSLPPTIPHGYWDVLDRLDDLHAPLCRPPIDADPPPPRAEHYAAARKSLAALARLSSAPPGIGHCIEMLQDCWRHDPGRVTAPSPQDEP
ncbi:hypothetical protein GCM10028784_30330 [Myceligenerans cantabricum]